MLGRIAVVTLAACLGGGAGWLASSRAVAPASVPEPYVVPKLPGGTALSVAMVHDVLHERYVRPGPAYYRERNRLLQAAMERHDAEKHGELEYLAYLNDLAVGQYALAEHETAVETLNRKRSLQRTTENQWQAKSKLSGEGQAASRGAIALSPDELELYRTYANFGTFLILDSLREGLADNDASRQKLIAGTDLIREAIALNAESHFGREKWQLVILEFLLAVSKNPALLLEFDMIGNRLDAEPSANASPHAPGWVDRWQAAAKSGSLIQELREATPGPDVMELRREIRRQWITRVGAEQGWMDAVPSVHREPAPFDEPTLAIVGMWMIGGGPNPHFALCLGGVMERVGQNRLAWQAYRRAEEMADGVWPDEVIRQGFVSHCRSRRARLEKKLAAEEGAPTPEQTGKSLARKFEEELELGRQYQRAYHEFETSRIAEAAPLNSENFYAPFYERYGRIATPVGKTDFVPIPTDGGAPEPRTAWIVFCAGLASLPAGLWLVRRERRKTTESRVQAN